MNLTKVWHQEAFQGTHRKKGYFEGWYLKLIDQTRTAVFALIPGVSIGKTREESHAFVQLINAVTGKTEYFRFTFDAFSANHKKFDVRIGGNHFWEGGIDVDLQNETTSLKANLRFENIEKYPTSLLHPGIMGPFSFVPGMECYHGIVNVHHEIEGELAIDGETLDYSGGHGYIEKDWGRSFPESWIWLQCNYFAEPDVSLMFSLAKIPLLGTRFLGMISFLRLGDQEYRFATYTRARLRHCSYAHDTLNVVIEDRRHRLTIRAVHGPAGLLAAPKNGMMTSTVLESISATVEVSLAYLNGQHIYVGQGTNAGMEFVEGILKN